MMKNFLYCGCGVLGLLGVLSCASQRVDQRILRLEQSHQVMENKIQDLSDQVLVMGDRLATLNMAVDKQATRLGSEQVVVVTKPVGGSPTQAPLTLSGRADTVTETVVGTPGSEFLGLGHLDSPVTRPLTNADLKPAAKLSTIGSDQAVKPDRVAVPVELSTKQVKPSAQKERQRSVQHTVSGPRPETNSVDDDPAASRVYNQAFNLFRSGQHQEAEIQLKSFANKYPTHTYSDNALFWLAEAAFAQGQFDLAAQRFEDVAKRYPNGNKVPEALYRATECYIQLVDRASASRTYRQLISQFPESVAAKNAEQHLVQSAQRIQR